MRKRMDLARLARWAESQGRDHWVRDIADSALEEVCDLCEIDGEEELAELVGASVLDRVEDAVLEFACAGTRPDGSSLARDYLKRRGWKETAFNRAFIEALHGSRLSVYEVSGVEPGKGFLARDLLFGEEPVRVEAPDESRKLLAWDLLVARILEVRGAARLGVTALPLSRAATGLLGDLRETVSDAADEAEGYGFEDAHFHTDEAIVEFWLAWMARAEMAARTDLFLESFNLDGEPLEFVVLFFPFAPGAGPEAVSRRLDGLDGFGPGDAGWELRGRRGGGSGEAGGASPDDPGTAAQPLAYVDMEDAGLRVCATSRVGGDAAREALERGLADLLGEPEAVGPPQGGASAADPPENGPDHAPPDLDLRLAGEFPTDAQKAALSAPASMLGGGIPMELAGTEEGREEVADWLKTLENLAAGEEGGGPERGRAFAWAWEALGVAELRR